MNSTRQAVRSIFAVFFLESAVLGNWIPRIPDIKDKLSLSDFDLGLALLAIPLGTILAFVVAGKVVESLGLRKACMIWLPLWSLVFLMPAVVNTFHALFAVLMLAGVAVGMCEVAMNTKADVIERQFDVRIMSRCHGFWSLGSMVGALTGSVFAHLQWSLAQHYLLIMPLLAVLGFIAAHYLPADEKEETIEEPAATDTAKSLPFKIPSRAIALLCLLPVGIMSVEGAFIDWSAVFMRQVLDASAIVIGVTYSFFSVVMAITRLLGDVIAQRFGDLAVVRYSSLSATAGIFIFATAPITPIAFIGATLSGLGVAIVYPLAVSAAARRPGSTADNVAAISLFAFTSFLVAPPLIGFVSDSFGLRVALLALTPVALSTFFLAKEIDR